MRSDLGRQSQDAAAVPPTPLAVRETELIARIRAGDQVAFETMVTTYAAELHRYLGTLVDSPATAEELVQDLFLTVWRMGASWTVRTSLKSYLFRAAHNLGLGYGRRQRVTRIWTSRVMRGDLPSALGTPPRAASDRLESSELQLALDQAIAELPKRCRQVAHLRFQHELSHAEIAEALGVTVKAVEHQIGKALKVLRVEMGHYLDR